MNDEQLKKINKKLTGIAALLFAILLTTANINKDFIMGLLALFFGVMGWILVLWS